MDAKKPLFGSAAKSLTSFSEVSEKNDSWLESNNEPSKTIDATESTLLNTPIQAQNIVTSDEKTKKDAVQLFIILQICSYKVKFFKKQESDWKDLGVGHLKVFDSDLPDSLQVGMLLNLIT